MTKIISLPWGHNERDGVSNHQPHDCLFNHLFRFRSKETSKLRVTGLCEGNSPGTGEFPAQRASNAENVSIWWRHHAMHRLPKQSVWQKRANVIFERRWGFSSFPSSRGWAAHHVLVRMQANAVKYNVINNAPYNSFVLCFGIITRSSWHQQIGAETKWPPFCRRHFQKHFFKRKCINSD